MNLNKKRLIVTSGTTHTIEFVALLKHLEEENKIANNNTIYTDYLVFAEFCLPNNPQKLAEFEQLTTNIAQYIWKWESITSLNDNSFWTGESTQEQREKFVREKLNVTVFDELFIVNNIVPMNDLLLRIYKTSKKISIGDLGLYHNQVEIDFVPVDAVYLSLPVEYEKIPKNIPFGIIPKKNLVATFEKCKEYFLPQTKNIPFDTNKNNILLQTGNHTESTLIPSLEEEIAYYEMGIMPYIQADVASNTVVYIKPHPRQSFGQSEKIGNLLTTKYKIQVYIFEDKNIATLPVELLCLVFQFDKIVTLLSYSAVFLKYLYNIDAIVGDNPKLWLFFGQKTTYAQGYCRFITIMHNRLATWDEKSILFLYHEVGQFFPRPKISLKRRIIKLFPHSLKKAIKNIILRKKK